MTILAVAVVTVEQDVAFKCEVVLLVMVVASVAGMLPPNTAAGFIKFAGVFKAEAEYCTGCTVFEVKCIRRVKYVLGAILTVFRIFLIEF